MTDKAQADGTLNLENCVLAIADPDAAERGAAALRERGLEVVELAGEEDVERLQPKRTGLSGLLSKAAAAMGDELRIMDAVDRALSEGERVLIVPVVDEQGPDASELLKENGARSVWEFRGWTFVKTGSEGHAGALEREGET